MKNFQMHTVLFQLFALLLIVFIGSSCKPHENNKNLGYLDDDEFRRSFMSASHGDRESAEKLVSYYLHFKRDACLGFYWRERAAILGSTNAQSHIKAFFQTSDLEAYRKVLGRTNSVEENALFKVIKIQP